MITRRQFVRQLAIAAGGLLPWTRAWAGMRFEVECSTEEPSVHFLHAVQYRGGDWTSSLGFSRTAQGSRRRTSIAVSFQRHTLRTDPDLFAYPFCISPVPSTSRPSQKRKSPRCGASELWRLHLVNDASGYRGSAFERRIREEVPRLFRTRLSNDSPLTTRCSAPTTWCGWSPVGAW